MNVCLDLKADVKMWGGDNKPMELRLNGELDCLPRMRYVVGVRPTEIAWTPDIDVFAQKGIMVYARSGGGAVLFNVSERIVKLKCGQTLGVHSAAQIPRSE